MIVSIDTELLEAAIRTVVKVTSAGGANSIAHFKLIDGMFQSSATNKGTGVAINIPCKVKEKSKHSGFAVDPASLLAAIANRKNIQLEIGGSTVKVVSNKYKAELVTTTAEAEAILPKDIREGSDTMKLPSALVEFIRENLAHIELKPILETYSYMPVAVRVTEKGAFLACYDNWHMAFVTNKKVTGNLKFCLPVSSLNLLTKEFRGKSYKMIATESTLYAFNDSFELALTLPQQDTQNVIPPEEAFNLAMQIRKEKGINVLLAAEDILSISTNIDAVYKKGEHIDFEVDKTSCKVTLKSTFGRVSSVVRCKSQTPVSFRAGFGFMRDVLTKISGNKVEMTIVPERMLFFNKGSRTFMLALIDREEKKSKKSKEE